MYTAAQFGNFAQFDALPLPSRHVDLPQTIQRVEFPAQPYRETVPLGDHLASGASPIAGVDGGSQLANGKSEGIELQRIDHHLDLLAGHAKAVGIFGAGHLPKRIFQAFGVTLHELWVGRRIQRPTQRGHEAEGVAAIIQQLWSIYPFWQRRCHIAQLIAHAAPYRRHVGDVVTQFETQQRDALARRGFQHADLGNGA